MSEVKVRVESPISSTVYSLTTDENSVLDTVKQYLLSLGSLVQPATAFSLVENTEAAKSDDVHITYKMVLERQTYVDVATQLEQLRDEFGLAPGSSTCINSGPTRLYEIPVGSKKRKGITDETFLEAAEFPANLVNSFEGEGTANTVPAGDDDHSLGSTDGLVAAVPNPLIPKPAALELKFSKWQPLCRDPRIKMQGIIAFVYLVSNDGKEWHFVAYPEGYVYVPNLSNTNFVLPNTKTTTKSTSKKGKSQKEQTVPLQHIPTLVQAIEKVSPSSISNARKNSEKISQNILACVPVSQVSTTTPWLVDQIPDIQMVKNLSQLEIPTETNLRDWNEDFQISREVIPETISERITRDRSLCQTSTEFASAATEGATKIVEGAIKPLNPEEEVTTSKLYLSQGIFYTYGSDFAQPYEGIAGPVSARKAAKKDVAGVEQLMRHHDPAICPVLSTVVDYCGRRLIAQAPVPGIFRESEEPLIIYGQTEEQDDVRFDEKVDELMKEFADVLHLKKHPVNKAGVELQTSIEVHGTRSTDGRTYAIDLYRLQVPDLLSESNELNLLRFEAIDDYFTHHPDAEKLNPDVWMKPENLPEEYAKTQFPKDVEDVKAVARHVRENILKGFVKTISEPTGIDPLDGTQLTFSMHRLGINMRLLGLLYSEALAVKQTNLASVALVEAIARCLKVLLRERMETADIFENMTSTVESFFYDFKIRKDAAIVSAVENRLKEHFRFTNLPSGWVDRFFPSVHLMRLVSLKLGLQWDKNFKLVAVNPVVRYAFPSSLVANEALEAGLRSLNEAIISKEEGKGENNNGEANGEAKDEKSDEASDKSKPETSENTDAENTDASPDSEQSQLVSESLTIIAEAASIVTQIYGSSHSEVAKVLHRAALLFFEYGNDAARAIDFERKAITIVERVSGVDSYDTVTFYRYLAYYEKAAGHILTAIEIYKRVIELVSQVACDPSYSEIGSPFGAVGTMLLGTKKDAVQKVSNLWLKKAYDAALKTPSGPSGFLLFEYGQSFLISGDLKSAVSMLEKSYEVFEKTSGAENPNTVEAKKFLDLVKSANEAREKIEANKNTLVKNKNSQQNASSSKGEKAKNIPKVGSASLEDVATYVLSGAPGAPGTPGINTETKSGKSKSKSKKNKKAQKVAA